MKPLESCSAPSVRKTFASFDYSWYRPDLTHRGIGQRGANPFRAALLYSLEAVFCATVAFFALQEHLSTRALLGAAVLLSSELWASTALPPTPAYPYFPSIGAEGEADEEGLVGRSMTAEDGAGRGGGGEGEAIKLSIQIGGEAQFAEPDESEEECSSRLPSPSRSRGNSLWSLSSSMKGMNNWFGVKDSLKVMALHKEKGHNHEERRPILDSIHEKKESDFGATDDHIT